MTAVWCARCRRAPPLWCTGWWGTLPAAQSARAYSRPAATRAPFAGGCSAPALPTAYSLQLLPSGAISFPRGEDMALDGSMYVCVCAHGGGAPVRGRRIDRRLASLCTPAVGMLCRLLTAPAAAALGPDSSHRSQPFELSLYYRVPARGLQCLPGGLSLALSRCHCCGSRVWRPTQATNRLCHTAFLGVAAARQRATQHTTKMYTFNNATREEVVHIARKLYR
jgi:hypothetical protein